MTSLFAQLHFTVKNPYLYVSLIDNPTRLLECLYVHVPVDRRAVGLGLSQLRTQAVCIEFVVLKEEDIAMKILLL